MTSPFQDLDPKFKKKTYFTLLIITAAIVALFLLYHMVPWFAMAWKLISAVLQPLIIGCVLCYLLYPIVNFFEKFFSTRLKMKKGSRGLAVLLVLILLIAIIAGFVSILVWATTKQITKIDFDSVWAWILSVQASAGDLIAQVEAYLAGQSFDFSMIADLMKRLATASVTGVAGAVSSIFFGMIFAIYFLVDGERIGRYWKNAAITLLPARTIALMKELGSDADRCFSGYIRGQTLDAVIIGVAVTIAFLLMGMPYAIIIGLVTGVGNLIPYVGPMLGYGSVILINLLEFNPKMMVMGLIVLLILMFVDGNLINPRLLANTVQVHPLLVVGALLAGGAIGGLLGMLLAVPTGAFVKIQFDKLLEKKRSVGSQKLSE